MMMTGTRKCIVFDCGWTLVEDPFPQVLRSNGFRESVKELLKCSEEFVDLFFMNWSDGNAYIDFPFASHFLQEEKWIIDALSKSKLEMRCTIEEVVTISPSVLKLYRECALKEISNQELPARWQPVLASLRGAGHRIFVASNDREVATPIMLKSCYLRDYFDDIFTSESLSRTTPDAVKPKEKFFRAVRRELIESYNVSTIPIYIGDSFLHDIKPARNVGWPAVHFVWGKGRDAAVWLDASPPGTSDVWIQRPEELLTLLETALDNA